MNRLLSLGLPALVVMLAAACGPAPKNSCKTTGCSAGSVCNTNTGSCEIVGTGGGGGGGMTGGGATGGGGGTGGGRTGGGTGGGGVVVDPFDDGGVFVPGDICNKAIAVDVTDGGALVQVDLAMATDQYDATCSSSNGTGADLFFAVTLAAESGLRVTATDTSAGMTQDVTLTLLSSPCPAFRTATCVDSADPEVLTASRLPAGTWYVMVENFRSSATAGTLDVQFELLPPVAGPANDFCSAPQALTFTNGMAMASGTTVGAFNDSAGVELTCSTASALQPDVFYSFTLTQAQDVTVTATGTGFSPAVAITTTCGAAGSMFEKGCSSNSPASFLSRRLPAGTYFLVVDGDDSRQGTFDLVVTLAAPSPAPANESCTAPATLTAAMSLMADGNVGVRDYSLSCASGASGGDLVYSFTTNMAQHVTLTTTSVGGADLVMSLRGAPCDMDTAEVDCRDDNVSSPEVIEALNLPAGTWYVVVQSYYGDAVGTFGLSLDLAPPVLPPANDSCTSPSTLAPNMSQMVNLQNAGVDTTVDCYAYSGGDAVYAFTTSQPQRVVITATEIGMDADAVIELRAGPCETGTSNRCVNDSYGGVETLVNNNLPAGTWFVVIGSDGPGPDYTFGVQLAVEPPRPVTNDSCSTPDVITFTNNMATRSVDLSDAMADYTLMCPTSNSADGQDVVYSVSIPANQTLTVTATPTGTSVDPVLAVLTPMCTMAMAADCVDMGSGGGAETLVVPNTGMPMAKQVFIILKGYNVMRPGEVTTTFSLQ